MNGGLKKQTSYFLRGAISMTKGSNDIVVYSRFGFLFTAKMHKTRVNDSVIGISKYDSLK